MEDSVVTTRSLQWEQRILTVATNKFQKKSICLIFNQTVTSSIYYSKYIKAPWSYLERAFMSVIPTYVGNVVQNIYYNPIQI